MADPAEDVAFCSVCKANISSSSGKLLTCLHFSCLGCFNSKTEDNVFKCGLCATENKVYEIGRNVLLSDETRCTLCSDNLTANYKCNQCCDMMCAQCAMAHKRVKLTKDHVLTQEFILEEMCELHRNLPLQWYCKTCAKKSCSQCQLTCHVGHQHQPLKDYKVEQIDQSVAKIKGLKNSIVDYKVGLDATDDTSTSESQPSSVKDALKIEVDKFAERLKSVIEQNLEFEHEILEKCSLNRKTINERCEQVCLISLIANRITNSDDVICKAADSVQQAVSAFNQDCVEYDLKLAAAGKNFVSNLNLKEFVSSLKAKIRNAYMNPNVDHSYTIAAGTESNIIPLFENEPLNCEIAASNSENECQPDPNIQKTVPNIIIRSPLTLDANWQLIPTCEAAVVPPLTYNGGNNNMPTISCYGLSGVPDVPRRPRTFSGSKKRKKGSHIESTVDDDPADDLSCLDNGDIMHTEVTENTHNGSHENIFSEMRRPISHQMIHSDNDSGQKRRKLIEPIILRKSINNLSTCDQYSETSSSSRDDHAETEALRRPLVNVPEFPHTSPSTWDVREWEDFCSVCQNDNGRLLQCKGPNCTRVFHREDHIPSFSEDYVDNDPMHPFVCGLCQDPILYKISEDDVPKEKRKVSKMTLFEKKAAERILLELYCHPDSVHFHNSFPPVDFAIIREKLSGIRMRGDDFGGHRASPSAIHKAQRSPSVKYYHKIEEFIIDLNELFSNCFATFKDDSSVVFKSGKAVAKRYQELMELYLLPYVRLVETGTGERLLRKRPNSRSRCEVQPFHTERIDEIID